MIRPVTLADFRNTARRVPVEEGVATIGDDIDNYEGATALWLYADNAFIQEHPDAEGGHYLVIFHDAFEGTREELEARLWFDFFVSECIPVQDWSEGALCQLTADWCAWQQMELRSADEMLSDLLADEDNPPADESLTGFLQWFIRTWGQVVEGDEE